MDEHLFQRWGHSREEDHDGVTVYRPEGYDFPPSRGRGGVEFRADGGFVDWVVGRGDAREGRPGTWHAADPATVTVTRESGDRQALRVVRLEPDRLEVTAAPVA